MAAVLLAAGALRRVTERLRTHALARLGNYQLAFRTHDLESYLDEIEHAVTEVQETRRGSFMQDPVLVAMLLTFGGAGTLALLESLATAP